MLQIPFWKRATIWALCLAGLLMALPNAFYTRVETSNDAAELILVEGDSPQLLADEALWPSWLPSGLVNLGLDLRGGAHLLAEVQVEQVYDTRVKAMWGEVRDTLRDARDTVGTIRRVDSPEGQLRVRISQPEGLSQALEIVEGLSRPIVSISNIGAQDIVVTGEGDILTIELSEEEQLATDERTMQQSIEIIRRRVDEVGTREPTIQRQGEDRILIQVPGIGSAQELKELIGTTAQLSFHPVVGRTSDAAARAGIGNIILPDIEEEGVYYIVEETPVLTGEELVDAQPAFDQNGRPAVNFRFNVSGARKFGVYTSENVGSLFASVLDGEVVTAPQINQPITGGSGQITGNFTVESSTDLAVLLRAGALPAELTFVEERTIGPELGQDSIDAGKLACIVAFAAVLIFMLMSYTTFGLFANIALVINVGLIFGLLSMIGATLTLPGIAGIVLTIGMAVDANVLIFERIREELRAAKNPARAIELGYEKALSAILDANVTTFITAVILFVMGSGPVRGFAITLGLGIITSVFTAIYLTRLMLIIWYERKRPKSLLIKGIKLVPEGTKLNFFGKTKFSFGGSALAMIASVVVFVLVGLNYGIDFRGGTTFRTQAEQTVDVSAYRLALEPLQLGDVSITEVTDPAKPDQNVTQIRIEAQEGAEAVSPETVTAVETALETVDPTLDFTAVESVGPKVSGELVQTAVIAVILAIGAVLIYIWLRFEWQFSLGAVAALVHDVVITIGVFSILQIKFDLAIIAALLTIVGYSLNDTVVVFDRVRENLRKYKKMDLRDVLNLSINETLSRTVMTSVTTLLALFALIVLGGDVIRGFVFAMILGVVIGTYSSVFVASTILLRFGVKRDWSKAVANTGNQFGDIDA
ncbi:protein translocase subunit SecD [Cochlodiniinecator piscidefendens]|uniref:protein translocase subunit SecD n=1 Tax=Cochlodiniinecator piscidefendens TaxID=2715756 RepID=UPI00140E180E|nr:protein translocase subunit SecD [Cochlodiniinecator piscidefendens]